MSFAPLPSRPTTLGCASNVAALVNFTGADHWPLENVLRVSVPSFDAYASVSELPATAEAGGLFALGGGPPSTARPASVLPSSQPDAP